MAIKVKTKSQEKTQSAPPTEKTLKIPAITGSASPTPNIIIRAAKIMLMDIRRLLHPKQTAEELEAYTQFSNFAYGRK